MSEIISNILLELRIKHYIKNILIFLPPFFSLNLKNMSAVMGSVTMFVAFCFGSSSVYALNDILDKGKDAKHPVKSKRPIASGLLSVRQGIVISLSCFTIAVIISLSLSLQCFFVLGLYIFINIGYSVYLKKIPIIDVFCIALGFILRVFAGSLAINVSISDWLLITVMALSFFLGFGKRKAEMGLAIENTREVLNNYSKAFLENCMYSMMSISIVFYTLWSIDEKTVSSIGTDKMIYTMVIVIVGLLRYAQITETVNEGDPTTIIFKDRMLQIIILVYIVTAITLMYL